MEIIKITPASTYLKVDPIHRVEERMDMDKERDAKRGNPIIVYGRTGKARKLNDEAELGSNLDIVC